MMLLGPGVEQRHRGDLAGREMNDGIAMRCDVVLLQPLPGPGVHRAVTRPARGPGAAAMSEMRHLCAGDLRRTQPRGTGLVFSARHQHWVR
jgi:hypothetical protein